MNDNTVLRIKVPAHLYESVKEQLTLKEAKGKTHYGAGMEVVKEKKMKTTKDNMQNIEEMKDADTKKKTHSLEELKAVKEKLEKKINEMEGADKKAPVEESETLDMFLKALGPVIDVAKDNAGFLAGIGGITGIAKMIADKIKQDPEARKNLDKKTGAGSTDTSFLEVKKKDVEDK